MSLQILRKGENEMAKKEVKTEIKYDAQGSDVKEINDALQSASKRGTGNAGYSREEQESNCGVYPKSTCRRQNIGSDID